MNDLHLKWYGNVPLHWDTEPCKRFMKEVQKYSEDGSETLLSVTEKRGVVRREELIDEGDHLTRADSLEGYKKCKPGDLIVNIMLAWKRGLGVAGEAGIVSPAYAVFRPDRDRMNPRFLDYLARTDAVVGLIKAFSYGVVDSRLRIYPDRLLGLPFVRPPVSEQIAIADFLDYETSRVEKLVERNGRLIELLEQKRTAVITRAVTKGLDPDVPMADSGVEWLGEIPEHWEVVRLRYLCQVTTGDRDTQDAEEDGEYPFVVRSDNLERISSYAFDGEGVLTSGDGAGVGEIFHHLNGKFDFHQRVYLFHDFHGIAGRFFYHFLRENLHKVVLAVSAKSTVDSLRRPMLLDFPVALPPQLEQQRIVTYIDQQEAMIDRVKEKIMGAMALLKEYRTALISAAVTGTIDLRDKVA